MPQFEMARTENFEMMFFGYLTKNIAFNIFCLKPIQFPAREPPCVPKQLFFLRWDDLGSLNLPKISRKPKITATNPDKPRYVFN